MYSLSNPFEIFFCEPSGFMVNSPCPRVLSLTYSWVAKIFVAFNPIDNITATINIPTDLKKCGILVFL